MQEGTKNQERRFYPLFLSKDGFGMVQSDEENRDIWNSVDALNKIEKSTILSNEIAESFFLLEKQFSLNQETTHSVIVATRSVLLKKKSPSELFGELKSIFSDEQIAKNIYEYIEKNIFTLKVIEQDEETEADKESIPESPKVKMALLQALAKFPNLGNQMISQERIKVKSQPEPVRGSLYNWIKCYRDELGIGQHSTVERGQFLFRSENGRKLQAGEREQANLILKSIEENLPLDIDPERQVIVFPALALATAKSTESDKIKMPEEYAMSASATPVATPGSTEQSVSRVIPEVSEEITSRELFTPKPAPARVVTSENAAQKFQPTQSPYEKIVIPSQDMTSDTPLPSSIDVSNAAEKLKREPKPEWIKGAFTQESIPDKVKAEPVSGAMSFSLNHVLPVEQEVAVAKPSPEPEAEAEAKPKPQSVINATKEEELLKKTEEELIPKKPVHRTPPKRTMSQFHIRPVSRGDEN
jgi:hypothetical protein